MDQGFGFLPPPFQRQPLVIRNIRLWMQRFLLYISLWPVTWMEQQQQLKEDDQWLNDWSGVYKDQHRDQMKRRMLLWSSAVVVLKEARMNIWRTRVFNHHTRTGFDPFPGMFPSSSLLSSTHGLTPTHGHWCFYRSLPAARHRPFVCTHDVVLVIADGRRCLNGNISEISHLHQLGSSAIAARDFTPIIKGHTCWGCE